jgi:hypothetical protein
MAQVLDVQLTGGLRIRHDPLLYALCRLRSNMQHSVCGIDIGSFEGAKFLAPQAGVVGHGKHDPVAEALRSRRVEDGPPLLVIWNPG